jgi:hypothetical protein
MGIVKFVFSTSKCKWLTVFAFSGVAFHHLITSLEAGKSHVSNRILFMMRFFSRNDWRKRSKREVNSRKPKVRSILAVARKKGQQQLTEPNWFGIRSSQRSKNHRIEVKQ